jgi:hypothetical protein
MNLFEILKQFKNIEPDADFSATSRRAILATEPASLPMTARRTIFRIIETGVAVALTGFFVLLITGAFSGSTIEPTPYEAMNPQSLHAEAQAIDMQIQLANLNYTESESSGESTAPTAAGGTATTTTVGGILPVAPLASSTPAAATLGTGTATASSTATTTVSLDQALQALSE